MIKGFVNYRDGRIPFVIENYVMELFTDDPLLTDFTKEYNFQNDYVLRGQYFDIGGFQPQRISMLVDYSTGNTCYLLCYILEGIGSTGGFDSVGFQSPCLDDIFRYRYNYLDLVRAGVNLATCPQSVYVVPFELEESNYALTYRIGQNERMGLLDDINKKGEALVQLRSGTLRECFTLSNVLHRFAAFLLSRFDVSFKKIILYNSGHPSGWFYCNLVSDKAASYEDIFFCQFDVMKYVPKVLNNVALDPGGRITNSVPLGHLVDSNFPYTPQKFIEQITAFEYLYEKLCPQKAKNRKYPLKAELKEMFSAFPEILEKTKISPENISEELKEVRRNIVHGYTYYYDFKNNSRLQYMLMRLSELIKAMSLQLMGFTYDEIKEYYLHIHIHI